MTGPATFVDDPPPLFAQARVRRTDPLPSHVAAARMNATGKAEADAGKVLAALRTVDTATFHELHAMGLGMDKHTIMKRLNTLYDRGQASHSDNRVRRTRVCWCADCRANHSLGLMTAWRAQ